MVDLPLEQLMQMQVTTASRYAQTALEAPAAVSVVTAEDIRLLATARWQRCWPACAGCMCLTTAPTITSAPGALPRRATTTRACCCWSTGAAQRQPLRPGQYWHRLPDRSGPDRAGGVCLRPGSAVYRANASLAWSTSSRATGASCPGPRWLWKRAARAVPRRALSVGTVDAYGGDWLVAATGPRAGAQTLLPKLRRPQQQPRRGPGAGL